MPAGAGPTRPNSRCRAARQVTVMNLWLEWPCKFHAFMTTQRPRHSFPSSLRSLAVVMAAVGLLAAAPAAQAARADRSQPITIDADKPGTVDMLKQVVVFNGNVVITQGTITIRAERAEIREGADGFRSAVAVGTASQPASFRQKREGLDEFIQGTADRIEYEGRGDVVRFVGGAQVQRLRNGVAADQISGERITYDSTTEVFSVAGSTAPAPASGASGPGNGRVRVILTPREGSEAAEPAASGASR